jgi:hypothetical protein
MIEKEYSQLPVVDGSGRPLGVITFQSIVEATSSFGVAVKDLTVGHAVVRADEFSPDDDLFDVIDRLQDNYAVLVVNDDGTLGGIVTTYDSTEYFRRRGEDLMLVEDIEGMLKDMILAAFGVPEGGEQKIGKDRSEEDPLTAAIRRISDNQAQLVGQYRDALRIYLAESGLANKSSRLDQAAFDASVAKLAPAKGPRPFDSLTFYDYVELFLHDQTWQHFGPTLQMERTAVRQLLEGVRSTRNHLAHFRNDLSAMARTQLRFCWNWLQKHQPQPPAASAALQPEGGFDYVPPTSAPFTGSGAAQGPSNYEQPPGGDDSKYALLAAYFQQQPAQLERVSLRFDEIERIVRGPLPASARLHRGWWTNNTVAISRLQRWLDAGWRVTSVNMAEQVATFERIPERQRRLIHFFVELQTDLGTRIPLPQRQAAPTGEAWQVLAPAGGAHAGLYYMAAFGTDNHFRVELYIDTGDRARNNNVFDALSAQRQAIERSLETQLSWERMDDRRAARIAWLRSGAIGDTDEELAHLRAWAADAVERLAAVLDPLLQALPQP